MKAQSFAAAAVLVVVVGACAASAQPCYPDRNGDGQPMYSPVAAATRTLDIPANGQVVATVFADLDGDGDLDAVACSCPFNKTDPPGRIVLLENDGDGLFAPPVNVFNAGHCPVHAAGADVDQDGDNDLIVADRCKDSAVLLVNMGDGTFEPGVDYPVGLEPCSVAVADLNADGLPDVVAYNQTSKDLSILLGQIGGGLAPEKRTTPLQLSKNGEFPFPGPFFALADVDGDGDIDAAVPASGGVLIVLNDGAGNLTAGPKAAVSAPYAAASGDFDNDGDIDLASCTQSMDMVYVHLNNGGGMYAPAVGYDVHWPHHPTIREISSITVGDFNGDGNPDLATGAGYDSQVRLLMGQGDGSFEPVRFRSVDGLYDTWFVSAGDVNGDGFDDLGVQLSGFYPALFTAFLSLPGSPAASYEPNVAESKLGSPEDVQIADMNGDGDPDAVQASGGKGAIVIVNAVDGVFLGDGVKYPVHPDETKSHLVRALVADFNGDGWPDVAASDVVNVSQSALPGLLAIFLNKGDGTLDTPQHILLPEFRLDSLAAADVDGDGDLDLGVWGCTIPLGAEPTDRVVVMLMNDRSGALTPTTQYVIDTKPYWPYGDLEFADMDGDGDQDILATAWDFEYQVSTPGTLRVRLNKGGLFDETYAITTTQRPRALATSDVDDDGDMDVFVLHQAHLDLPPPQIYLSLYVNDGRGGLTLDRQYSTDDQIGHEDLRVFRQRPGDPFLIFFTGASRMVVQTFDYFATNEPPLALYGAGLSKSGLAVRERLDGMWGTRLDVIMACEGPNQLQVFLDRSCPATGGGCPADCDANGELNIDDFICFQTLYAVGSAKADCDNSGRLDIDDFICFQTAYAVGC